MASYTLAFHLLLVSISVLGADAQCSQCSLPYVTLSTGCYFFSGSTKLNWWQAAERCRSLNGVLVVIDSEMENEAIRQHLIQTNANSSFIGAYDLGHEGTWYWESSRKRVEYSDWTPGQPDDLGGSQHCATMWKADNYHWNDDGCSQQNSFICEAIPSTGVGKACHENCGRGCC